MIFDFILSDFDSFFLSGFGGMVGLGGDLDLIHKKEKEMDRQAMLVQVKIQLHLPTTIIAFFE
jgi:hypothetical protein